MYLSNRSVVDCLMETTSVFSTLLWRDIEQIAERLLYSVT